MNTALHIIGLEQYITNTQGVPEFVVLPIERYRHLIEFIENYGIGLAIQEAEGEKRYNKEDALRFLDDEN
ncbi:MAG: hypothetical protein AB7S75_10915 [Desulfococcaceae bacterium]